MVYVIQISLYQYVFTHWWVNATFDPYPTHWIAVLRWPSECPISGPSSRPLRSRKRSTCFAQRTGDPTGKQRGSEQQKWDITWSGIYIYIYTWDITLILNMISLYITLIGIPKLELGPCWRALPRTCPCYNHHFWWLWAREVTSRKAWETDEILPQSGAS